MSGNYEERDVTFDIIEEIGVISTQETGWAKEINLVRWNGGLAKYDIRDWDPSHERMSRGITLHEDEMRRVLELMKRRRSRQRNKPARPSVEATELPEEQVVAAEELPEEQVVACEDQVAETDDISFEDVE